MNNTKLEINTSFNASEGYERKLDNKLFSFIAYEKFLFKSTFKKTSSWIMLMAFSLITLIFILIPKFLILNSNSISQDAELRLYIPMCMIFVSICTCLGAGTQGVLKTINVFIDPQKDGTEILIVSKPMTRMQIVISRFLFLFIYGIVISIINMLMVIIGTAIMGFEYYDGKLNILYFGTFGASFLSFAIMGIIAAIIGLFIDGKTARVLPIVVLGISAVGSMLFEQLSKITIDNPMTILANNSIDKVNKDLSENKYKLYTDDGETEIKEFVKYFGKENTFFKLSEKDNAIIISGEIYYRDFKNNVAITKLSTAVEVKSNIIDAPPNCIEPSSHKLQIARKLIEASIESNFKINASSAYIFHYLNPMSAFNMIMGSSVFLDEASKRNIATNYTYWNFKYVNLEGKDNRERWVKNQNKSNTELHDRYIEFSKIEIDPIWAISLLWSGIFVCAATLTIFGYLRKDFK